MKSHIFVGFCASFGLIGSSIFAQPQNPPVQATDAAAQATSDAIVTADPIPADLIPSAVAAVSKLGEEVVMGHYQVAIERMNPLWKERNANYVGGKEALERQLAKVAAQMVQQGISMISFKPQGQPRVYQVTPGKRGESLVYTKWLVLVPTVTKFRIMRNEEGQAPKVITIESIGYQVAISDKEKYDWTFIDGAGLKVSDLRNLFITLPLNMELPPVGKREVK